jgi:hypothetical protein
MTIQAEPAIAYRTGTTKRIPTKSTTPLTLAASDPAALQQLITAAVRTIEQKLPVDLVWIGEVAMAPRDGIADDDEGCGPPDVTVLATSVREPVTLSQRAHPVLPACLTQVAWDCAVSRQPVEMTLRNPTRVLAAFPGQLPTGAWLVLIVVAPHNSLTHRDTRILAKLVDALGLAAAGPTASGPA